jgi:hypothetical protein
MHAAIASHIAHAFIAFALASTSLICEGEGSFELSPPPIWLLLLRAGQSSFEIGLNCVK